jgi:CSLREA domain-containing protein
MLYLFPIATLLAGFVSFLQPARPAYAAILVVNTTSDELNAGNSQCSLREAITNVNNATSLYPECHSSGAYGVDLITFAASTDGTPITLSISGTGEDVNATGDLDILFQAGSLTIQGNGPTNTIIDGDTIDRVFHVFGRVTTLDSLTVRGGSASQGGGMYVNSGTTTVDASVLSGNTATSTGGGIYVNTTGILNVENGSVIGGTDLSSRNSASSGGGIYNSGTATVNDSTIGPNNAVNGGGIFNLGNLVVTNGSSIGGSLDASNQSGESGGGIYNSTGTTTVISSTVSYNYAGTTLFSTGYGAGIYSDGDWTRVHSSTISSNVVERGPCAGIYSRTVLTVTDSTVGGVGAGNTANLFGGGICNLTGGSATVTNSRILHNRATNAGAVYNYVDTAGAVSVTGSCIVGNSDDSFANDQPAQQTATGNWWGAATGPNTPTADTTSGNVDTSSYLTAAILGCPRGYEYVYLPLVIRNHQAPASP